MTTNLWIEQFWYDYKLKWNPEEYGGEYALNCWLVSLCNGWTLKVEFEQFKTVFCLMNMIEVAYKFGQIQTFPKLFNEYFTKVPKFVIFIILKWCPLVTEGKPCRREIILLIYNLSDLALLAQIT